MIVTPTLTLGSSSSALTQKIGLSAIVHLDLRRVAVAELKQLLVAEIVELFSERLAET